MDRDKPPNGLQTAGQALWAELLDAFELVEHERRLLVEACRCADVLDQLAAVVASEGVMDASGRVHPAVVEARQQRLVLTRLVASLRVPDDESGRPPRRGAARGPYVA